MWMPCAETRERSLNPAPLPSLPIPLLPPPSDVYARSFGLAVAPQMTRVAARLLDPPQVAYKDKKTVGEGGQGRVQ